MPDTIFDTKALTTGVRPLDTTDWEYYSTPSGYKTLVKEILFCNSSSGDMNANLYFVPSGEVVSEQVKYFSEFPVQENTTNIASLNTVMEAGDSIHASIEVEPSGGYVNMKISGIEIG